MIIIIAYILTLIAVYFGITAAPNALIGGVIARITGNLLIGMLLGSIIIWVIIDLLWKLFFASHIPVLVFALSFLILGYQYYRQYDFLNIHAKRMMGGEQWAIVIVAIYTMFDANKIQWF